MTDAFKIYMGINMVCFGFLYVVLTASSRSNDGKRMIKIRSEALKYLKAEHGDVTINKIGYHRDGVVVNFSAGEKVRRVLYREGKFSPMEAKA